MIWVCLKIGYTDTHDIAIYIDGEKNWSAIGSTRCWATVDLLSRFFPIDWPDMIEMGNLSAPEDVWWLFWDSDSKFHWICLYWKWRPDLQLFFFFRSLCWLLSEVRGQCAWNPDGITRWFYCSNGAKIVVFKTLVANKCHRNISNSVDSVDILYTLIFPWWLLMCEKIPFFFARNSQHLHVLQVMWRAICWWPWDAGTKG